MKKTVFAAIALVSLLVSVAASTAPALAQGLYGRLVLTVKDENGKGLPGVKVTSTCKELPNFRDEATTNKKGTVTLSFADGTKVYDLTVELEGVPPVEFPFKPTLRGTEKRVISLTRQATTTSGGAPTDPKGPSNFSPAETAFNLGVEALQKEDYTTAREQFLDALTKDSSLIEAHAALGGIYVETGDYEAALVSAEKLLAGQPNDIRALRILQEAHKALGHTEEAEEALQRLAQLGQGSAVVYNEGVAALRVGNNRQAAARFRQALDIEPDLGAAQLALAILLFNEGKYSESAALAEKFLSQEPEHPKALKVLFESYRNLGDRDKESAAFERLKAVDPKATASELFESAVKRFNGGDVEGALREFELTLEADPSRVKAHYYLGLCRVNQGNSAAAREQFEKFLELSPNDPEAPVAKQMLVELGG